MYETICGHGCNVAGRQILDMKASADERLLVTGDDKGKVCIWEIESGKLLQEIDSQSNTVDSVAFSADSETVISGGSDKFIRFWNVKDGSKVSQTEKQTAKIGHILCSPDAQHIIVTMTDATVCLVETATGKTTRILEEASGPIKAIAIDEYLNVIATGSDDKQIRIHPLDLSGTLCSAKEHTSAITALCFEDRQEKRSTYQSINENRMVSADQDGRMIVWAVERKQDKVKINMDTSFQTEDAEEPATRVSALLFLSQQKAIISAHFSGKVFYWNLVDKEWSWSRTLYRRGHGSRPKKGHTLKRGFKDFLPTGGLIQRTIRLVESPKLNASGDELVQMEDDKITRVVNTSQFLITAGQSLLRFWKYRTETERDTLSLTEHKAIVNSLHFSPDGRELVTGCQAELRVFSISNGRERHRMTGCSNEPISRVMFFPDSDRVLFVDKSINFFQNGGWVKIDRTDCSNLLVCLAVSVNNNEYIFATDSDENIDVFNTSSISEAFTKLKPKHLNNDKPVMVALLASPNQVVAAFNNGSIQIWDIKKLESAKASFMPRILPSKKKEQGLMDDKQHCQATTIDTGKPIASMCISPDQKLIASGHTKGFICLWKNHSYQLLQIIDTGIPPICIFFRKSQSTSLLSTSHTLGCVAQNAGVFQWKIGDGSTQIFLDYFETTTNESELVCAAYDSLENRIAVSLSNNQVSIFDIESGKELFKLMGLNKRDGKAGAQNVQFPQDSSLTWFDDFLKAKVDANPRKHNRFNILSMNKEETSKEKCLESMLIVPFTSLIDEDDHFGIWIHKRELPTEQYLQYADNVSEILVRTGFQGCTDEFLNYMLPFFEGDDREEMIYNAVRSCVVTDKQKLQTIFDFLQSENDASNTSTLFQVLNEMFDNASDSDDDKVDIWLPDMRSDSHSRSVMHKYIEYVAACLKRNRYSMTVSDWKNIGKILAPSVPFFPKVVEEIVRQTVCYQAPCWRRDDDEALFSQISADLEFLNDQPQPYNFSGKSLQSEVAIDTYMKEHASVKIQRGLLLSKHAPKKKVETYLDHRSEQRYAESKKKAILNKEPVMICFVPLFKLYGHLFRELANMDEGSDVFTSHAIKLAVDYKWKKFGIHGFIIWLIVYFLYLTIFFYLQYWYIIPRGAESPMDVASMVLGAVLYLISFLFLTQEAIQLKRISAHEYFTDWTNYIDLISFAVPPTVTALSLFLPTPIPVNVCGPLFTAVTMILFFETLNLLTVIGGFGQFVLMFFKVLKEAWAFLAFTVLFIACFWLAFHSLTMSYLDTSFFQVLFLGFLNQRNIDNTKDAALALKQVHHDGNTTKVSDSALDPRALDGLYMFFIFFINVILLNLLIALVLGTCGRQSPARQDAVPGEIGEPDVAASGLNQSSLFSGLVVLHCSKGRVLAQPAGRERTARCQ